MCAPGLPQAHRQDSGNAWAKERRDRQVAILQAFEQLAHLEGNELARALPRLRVCLDGGFYEKFEYDGHEGYVRKGHHACKLLVCLGCAASKNRADYIKISSRFRSAFLHDIRASAIVLAIQKPRSDLKHSGGVIDETIEAWSRLTGRKAFRWKVQGWCRTISLFPDPKDGSALCELRSIILFNSAKATLTKEEFEEHWRQSTTKEDKLSVWQEIAIPRVARPDVAKMEASTVKSIQFVAASGLDVGSLCTRNAGAMQCSAADLYRAYCSVRSRHLIHFGGVMAFKKARALSCL